MKAYSRSWLAITILSLVALTIIVLVSTSARAAVPMNDTNPASTPPTQGRAEFDESGNIVREGEKRINYVMDTQGGFSKVELEKQDTVVSQQFLPEYPFELSVATQMAGGRGSLASPFVESDTLLLSLEWKYSVYGSGIGASRISAFDIDGDDVLEMIMGGASGGGFGPDDFWYVVETTGSDAYDKVWSSDLYPDAIKRIAVADVNVDGIGEIYIGLVDGHVYRYDGLSMEQTGALIAAESISDLVIADADGDSDQEIVVSDGSQIYIFSAFSLALEWTISAYGGYDLAVGNVDADSAPEIVATIGGSHGYVLDGISHVLEWDYIAGFGSIVELGDTDSDGMAEIIGAASWDKITAFDADIRSPKWEIPTSHDIGALLVANTDGAGAPEIIYGDGQWGDIHCYDSATQTQRWSIHNPEHGVTDIGIGDVNNDDVPEVIWGAGHTSTGADHLYVADTITHAIEWSSFDITGPLTAVDAGDVDDDGQTEIVMVSDQTNSGYDDGAIHIFDAATHALEWRSTDLPGILAWNGVKSVKIGDVDDDGRTEFVLATANHYNGLIQVYDGQTHSLEHQSSSYSGASFTALAIGDVDNDGDTEIVVGQLREDTGATGVYLIVFDGATATEEWKSVGLDTYWGKVYDIELADVDNDSHLEIVASVAGEHIYAYDGATHQLDWFDAMQANALAVANLDSDIQKEILIGKYNGAVDVYDGITHVLQNSFALGSGTILGLLVDDINQDGRDEWVVSESTRLSMFRGATLDRIWQNSNLGGLLGNYNHLVSLDVDDDLHKELLLGSNYALYQLDITQTDLHVVNLPFLTSNLCMLISDGFSNPSSGWPIEDDGYFRWEYLGGEYRILVRPNYSWAAARLGIKYSDYTVAVDVRNPYNVDGTYGLVFGISDNWGQFYTFEIGPGGDYVLWRKDSTSWVWLAYGSSPYINTGTRTNRIKVVRTGAQILAYANDHLLVNTTDAMYTGLRYVGLIATSADHTNLDLRFDNFVMYPPGCPAAAGLGAAEMISSPNVNLLSPSASGDVASGQNDPKTTRPFELFPQSGTVPSGR